MSERCPIHDLEWKHGRNMANAPIGRYCPWDGSMHPDEFMAYLREPGTELEPTDKNYKVYITVTAEAAGEDPNEKHVISARNHGGPEDGWVEVGDEEREAMKRDGWQSEYAYIQFSSRGDTRSSKFYFEHLSDEQKEEFVELINKKKVKIGYPGHFYNLPFFVSHG